MSKASKDQPESSNSEQATADNSTPKPASARSASRATRSSTRSTSSPASSAATPRPSTAKSSAPKKTTTSSTQKQDSSMSKQATVRRVAIIGGNRIPFARSNGPYFTASNSDMFTAALNGLVERFNLQGQRLGEVVAGAVLKHSRDFNMTRECVLDTKLAPETPAYDIQQACGTGLQAAFLVANKIALGQ
ncbi:MAG: acetyl-CoA C-acyltransferase, partial [Sphingobacteriales bacterium]